MYDQNDDRWITDDETEWSDEDYEAAEAEVEMANREAAALFQMERELMTETFTPCYDF